MRAGTYFGDVLIVSAESRVSPRGDVWPNGDTSSSPFLMPEDPAVSRQISELGVSRRHGTGEFIYRQGTLTGSFHEVISGRIRIFIVRPDGAERVLSYADPGASFGESAAFDGLPLYTSALAVVDSRVLTISRDAVINAGRRNPEILLEIARRLARKQRLLKMHVLADGLHAQGRVTVLLHQLVEAHGDVRPDASARFRLRLSIDELALMIGVTRATMSREISHLVTTGLVVKEGREIVVRDVAELQHRARHFLG
jgi:CRP/FNR family cyclic AMP-dependent transcriptional regulator